MSLVRNGEVFKDVTVGLNPSINPYVAELVSAQKAGTLPVIYGDNLKDAKGNWQKKFKSIRDDAQTAPLILEIGCHKGQTLREMAAAHRNMNFVGMDITFKRVVISAKKIHHDALDNAISMLGDATHIPHFFEQGELDGTIIFFPDPWIRKKSQINNRLINENFCVSLFNSTKPGGFIWYKTDHKPYFEHGNQMLRLAGFKVQTTPTGLPAEKFESTFEKKFLQENTPTYGQVWVKPLGNIM